MTATTPTTTTTTTTLVELGDPLPGPIMAAIINTNTFTFTRSVATIFRCDGIFRPTDRLVHLLLNVTVQKF